MNNVLDRIKNGLTNVFVAQHIPITATIAECEEATKQDSLDVAELLALAERGARYRYNDKAVERLIKYAVANAPCPSELDTGLKDNEDCNHGLDESICVECWRQALQREPECDKIAGEIERQEQYAELGRLAAKIVKSGTYLAINKYNSCHPEADAYTECECRKNCPWNEFCKLRAEMEGGDGSE